MKKVLMQILGITLISIFFIYGYGIAFSNPDMTEIRLLITFWPQYLFMSVGLILGYILILKSYKKRDKK